MRTDQEKRDGAAVIEQAMAIVFGEQLPRIAIVAGSPSGDLVCELTGSFSGDLDTDLCAIVGMGICAQSAVAEMANRWGMSREQMKLRVTAINQVMRLKMKDVFFQNVDLGVEPNDTDGTEPRLDRG